jgi:hypothetical protein
MSEDSAGGFDKDLRLKKLDHEHAEYLKRMELDWSLRRDALQYTKEYGLFTLRSCLVLNGGAIVAILAFIGNLYGRGTASPPVRIHDLDLALFLFVAGLVAVIVASICGYFNFLTSQKRLNESAAFLPMRSVLGASTPDYSGRLTRRIATGLVVISVTSFVIGVLSVAYAISPY